MQVTIKEYVVLRLVTSGLFNAVSTFRRNVATICIVKRSNRRSQRPYMNCHQHRTESLRSGIVLS